MKWIRKILEYLRGEPQHLDKLMQRGLKVGKNFTRMSGVVIDAAHCYHITIGDDVCLAPRVHILAHDASTWQFLGKTRAANVKIGNKVFVGAGSIILPGVHIGDNVIIGAGSIVTKDIPNNSVAVGNPARVVSALDVFLDKEKAKMYPGNTIIGINYNNPNDRVKATTIAEQYGEIFVS